MRDLQFGTDTHRGVRMLPADDRDNVDRPDPSGYLNLPIPVDVSLDGPVGQLERAVGQLRLPDNRLLEDRVMFVIEADEDPRLCQGMTAPRSEERRVGKGWVSTFKLRGAPK